MSYNPQMINVQLPGNNGVHEFVSAMIETWDGDLPATAILRDVTFYTEDLTYGDRIRISEDRSQDEPRFIYQETLETSDWNAMVATLPTDHLAIVQEQLQKYHREALFAGKWIINGPVTYLAGSVLSSYTEDFNRDMDILQHAGFLTDATWTTYRS